MALHTINWIERGKVEKFICFFSTHTHVVLLSSKRIQSAGSFILEGKGALVLCSCRGSGTSGGLGFLPVSLCPCGLSIPSSFFFSPLPLSFVRLSRPPTRNGNYFCGLHGRWVCAALVYTELSFMNRPLGGEVELTQEIWNKVKKGEMWAPEKESETA